MFDPHDPMGRDKLETAEPVPLPRLLVDFKASTRTPSVALHCCATPTLSSVEEVGVHARYLHVYCESCDTTILTVEQEK